ncbi:RelB/StbD replicon stabilization protein (antitoxin to RelE/StbE) [uncultured Candidatus Thioglobus sp.]|nr:RelB/StbD replicon stabilization protein (antitoxin to RelE/StbE) [uncultured Candidatus Thioglobus sp.]
MLAIRLPESVEQRLEDLAALTGRTKTYYAREAIVDKIQDLEDIYLAEKEIEDIRAGKVATVSSEEMWGHFDLED